MPMAISGIAASLDTPASSDTSWPMPAPMASDGANMPPGAPDQLDSQVAQNFSSV